MHRGRISKGACSQLPNYRLTVNLTLNDAILAIYTMPVVSNETSLQYAFRAVFMRSPCCKQKANTVQFHVVFVSYQSVNWV